MKHAQSWSIRDVPPQVRELAREAADREGVPVGDWLARKIADANAAFAGSEGQSEQQRGDDPAQPLTGEERRSLAKFAAAQSEDEALSMRHPGRIDDAVVALAKLLESNKHAQDYASRAMQSVASEINAAARDQAAVLQSLNERVEGVEEQADSIAQRNGEIAGRLNALSGDIETLGKSIASTREASDRVGLFIQEQLSNFTHRVRSAETRVANYHEIENAVATLGAAQSATTGKLDELGGNLLKLGNNLRSVREISERVAATIQGRLDAIAERVQSTEASLAGYPEIEESVARFAAQETVTAGRIAALAANVQKLGTDLISARDDSARLEKIIQNHASSIAQNARLAASHAANIPRIEEAVSGLSKRDSEFTSLIGMVTGNVETLEQDVRSAHQSSNRLAETIEGRLTAIAGRVESAEGRLEAFSETDDTVEKLKNWYLETAGQLGTLTGRVLRIEDEGASDRKTSKDLVQRMHSAEERLATYPKIEETVAQLSGRDVEIKRQIGSLIETAGKLGKHNVEMASRIGTLTGSVETLGNQIAAGHDNSAELDKRLRSTEERVATYPHIEETVAKLGEHDTEMAGRVGALAGNVDGLGHQIAAARGDSAELAKRLGSAEHTLARYSHFEETVAKLGEHGAEIAGRVGELAGNVDALDNRVAAAQDSSTELAQRLGSAEERLARYSHIDETIAWLSENDAAAADRIGTLAGNADALGRQIAAAQDTSEGLARRLHSAEERLEAQPALEQAVAKLERTNTKTANYIDVLAGDIQNLGDEFAATRDGSKDLTLRMQSAEEQIATYSQSADTISDLVARDTQTSGRIGALAKSVEQLGGAVDSVQKDSKRLGDSVEERLAAIADRVRAAEERLAGQIHIDDKLDKLDEANEATASQVSALTGSFKKLSEGLQAVRENSDRAAKTVQEQLNSLSERMDSAGAESAVSPSTGTAIAELRGQLNAIDQRTKDAVAEDTASIKKNLEALSAQVQQNARQSGDFEKLQETLVNFGRILTKVQEESHDAISRLTGNLADISSRLAKMETGAPVSVAMHQPAAPAVIFAAPDMPPIADASATQDDDVSTPALADLPPLISLDDIEAPTRLVEADAEESPAVASEEEPQALAADIAAPSQPPAPVPDYLAMARRAAQQTFDRTSSEDNRQDGRTKGTAVLAQLGTSRVAAIAACLVLVLGLAAYWMTHSAHTGVAENTPVSKQPGIVVQNSVPPNLQIVTPSGEPPAATQPAAEQPATDQPVTEQPAPAPAASRAPAVTPAPTVSAPATLLERVTKRADMGDSKAMLALGVAYTDGTGVKADEKLAGTWLQKAADAGEGLAQFRLGVRQEKGIGGPKNLTLAVRWYSLAAAQGNRKAMHNLAVAAADGAGAAKNYDEAARWFRAAADLGLADSQFNLAVLYEHGLGVPASLAEAYKWYAIAGANGDAESKERSAVIATQIPPAEKDAADVAVAAFMPQAMKTEANVAPEFSQVAAP